MNVREGEALEPGIAEAFLGERALRHPLIRRLLAIGAERRLVLMSLLVGALVFLPYVGAVGLWDPWESHYGEVAREMIARMFVYEIPYRCLVPKDVQGLLVAGRCLSVDHHADVYTRNQGTAMASGVAAGAAAALAARAGVTPRDVDVRALQAKLRELRVDLDLLRRLGPSPDRLE